jgi:hypothetical protein
LKAEIDKELISLRDWQDNQFNFQRAKKEFDARWCLKKAPITRRD